MKASYINTFVEASNFLLGIFRNIIIIPIVLTIWGSEKYGLLIAILAFIELVKIFDVGYQNYVRNEYLVAYNKDLLLAKKIIASNIKISYSLGFLELIIFTVFWKFNLINKFLGISTEVFSKNSVGISIFIYLVVWALIGSVSGILHKIIIPINYARSASYGIILRIFEIIIIVFGSYFKFTFFEICLSLASSTFFCTIAFLFDIKNKAPDFFPWWQGGEYNFGLKYFKNSLSLTFNGLVEQFTTNNVFTLISSTLNVATIPIYTTVRTISNTFLQLLAVFTNPLVPKLAKYCAHKDTNNIYSVVYLNWFICNLLIGLPLFILPFFIEFLYDYWVKGSLKFSLALFLLLALGAYFNSLGKIFFLIINILNLSKFLNIISLTRLAIVIGLCFFLIQKYKLVGVGFAILISEFICSFVLPFIFFKRMATESNLSKNNLFYCLFSILILSLNFLLFHFGFSKIYNLIFLIIFFILIFLQYNLLDKILLQKISFKLNHKSEI